MNKLQTVYIPKTTFPLNTKGTVKDLFELKPNVYIFTPEELKQLLEEYTNRIVKNVEFGQIENSKEYIECVESITNQLPLMLKELGI